MDYTNFSVEDFVLDREFRNWVVSNDPELDRFWHTWMKDHPDRVKHIQEAKAIVKHIDFPTYSLDKSEKQSMFNQIRIEIEQSQEKETKQRHLDVEYKSTVPYRPGLVKLAVAASVSFLLVVAGYLFITFSESGRVAYQTGYNETQEVILNDGSRVILNANSKLYVGEFSSDNEERAVWLEGEAFFDVTHTIDDKKFVVHANKIDVNVLGTEFNVFARGKRAEVALASGKVTLANKSTNRIVEMKPGDQVTFKTPKDEPTLAAVNPNEISAWKDNLLIFRRTSLEEISELLKSNYGIDVFFTEGVSEELYFTGTVPANDIDMLLKTLSVTFDLQIQRKDKTLIIKPNPEK